MYCPKCGKTVGAEDLYCGFCGENLDFDTSWTVTICPSCGKDVLYIDEYCRHCGVNLEKYFADKVCEPEREWCSDCGEYIPIGLGYCPKCGASLASKDLSELQAGTIVGEKYEVLAVVGKTQRSIVYLGMDTRINKQWAIKQIKKDDKVLLTEFNILKALDHVNIPRIVDIISDEHFYFVIMDFLEGESLSNVLKQYGALPEKTVIDFGIQICGILEYLSTQTPPIINRDIKPAAFILRPDGRLMLTDFSIARRYVPGLSKDEFQLGTSGYAAPEQYGTAQTDVRTDIYSLGRTLHQLVTGADPRNLNGVYAPIRQWNSNLSEGLEYIIEKCTQKNPADRYQTAAELEADLRNVNWLPHRREKRSLFKKLFR